MFFRRKHVATLTFSERLEALKASGFTAEPQPGGWVRIARQGCAIDLKDDDGAIRSAGRCDIYMGIGDSAEQTAGYQLAPGALYYLAVKPELVGTNAELGK